MGTTQKFKSAIKSTFKLQPSTFCFPRHRNEDNSVWHHSHIGLGAMIGYSEAQEPCGCGVMYCPCPGVRREFLESPHTAKRVLEAVNEILAEAELHEAPQS